MESKLLGNWKKSKLDNQLNIRALELLYKNITYRKIRSSIHYLDSSISDTFLRHNHEWFLK